MRIVHLITGLGFGGAERLKYDFLRRANKPPFEHHVISLRSGHFVDKIRDLGIPVHITPGLVRRYDPVAYYRIKRLIKQIKPDVIHAALWSSTIHARLIGRALSIPVITDVHLHCRFHGALRNSIDAATAHLSRRIIPVGEAVKDSFAHEVLGYLPSHTKRAAIAKRVTVIRNGIDAEAVRAEAERVPVSRASFGLTDDDIVFGAVGRLDKRKCFDVLIRALSKVANAKVLIIGDGDQRDRLPAIAREVGVTDRLIFAGARPDARACYPSMDCYVLPSKGEGLSIALLEAMCFALPVITTAGDEGHEVIRHNENGLLVPAGDVDALAEAMRTLAADKKKRAALGTHARDIVESEFSMRVMVDAYLEVYRDVRRSAHPECFAEQNVSKGRAEQRDSNLG